MKSLIQNNSNFLVTFSILFFLFNINVLAGSVIKETKSNVYKMFYKVDKMTTKYVKKRITNKNKQKICKRLRESTIQFLHDADIDIKEHNEYVSLAKKIHRENPSHTMDYYFFYYVKNLRARWFSREFNKFLFRVKITKEDVENIHFQDIDISRNNLQNIYSLDNEYDAGEASFKNINKMVLIQEIIGLTSYKLEVDLCNNSRQSYDSRKSNNSRQIELIEF